MAEATIQKTKAAGKGKWAAFQKNYLARWQLYLFLLLPIAYVIIFNYIPMAGILCVYPFVQKYFVKGVMIGSIKG